MIMQRGIKAFNELLVGGINPNKPVTILTDQQTLSPHIDVVEYEEACRILQHHLKSLQESLRPTETVDELLHVELVGDDREGYEFTMSAELRYEPKHFVASISFGDGALVEVTQPY